MSSSVTSIYCIKKKLPSLGTQEVKFCHIRFHFLLTKKKKSSQYPLKCLIEEWEGRRLYPQLEYGNVHYSNSGFGVLYTYVGTKNIAVHKLYSSHFSVNVITDINRGSPRKMSWAQTK
jgi:hypothetical protein